MWRYHVLMPQRHRLFFKVYIAGIILLLVVVLSPFYITGDNAEGAGWAALSAFFTLISWVVAGAVIMRIQRKAEQRVQTANTAQLQAYSHKQRNWLIAAIVAYAVLSLGAYLITRNDPKPNYYVCSRETQRNNPADCVVPGKPVTQPAEDQR